MLTTAPLTLSVELVTRERATQGTWRTLGVPTAGLVVHDERRDGAIHREIELQALTGDHLVDVVLEALGEESFPETEGSPTRGDHPDLEEFWRRDHGIDVPFSETRDLPDGVLVDGELAARATLAIAGPAGTSLAQLLGDGTRWWPPHVTTVVTDVGGTDRFDAASQPHASELYRETARQADESDDPSIAAWLDSADRYLSGPDLAGSAAIESGARPRPHHPAGPLMAHRVTSYIFVTALALWLTACGQAKEASVEVIRELAERTWHSGIPRISSLTVDVVSEAAGRSFDTSEVFSSVAVPAEDLESEYGPRDTP